MLVIVLALYFIPACLTRVIVGIIHGIRAFRYEALLNILNANDNRSVLQKSDIFDSDGNFVINSDGEEIGKERLKNKVENQAND